LTIGTLSTAYHSTVQHGTAHTVLHVKMNLMFYLVTTSSFHVKKDDVQKIILNIHMISNNRYQVLKLIFSTSGRGRESKISGSTRPAK
jgi:hypothetical protein